MIDRNEKLYRMLLATYDEDGTAFWGIVQELASINHSDDDTFAHSGEKADIAFQETIPEARELMRDLLRRGLVYVTRVLGTPPLHTRTIVPENEMERVIADTRSWLGPSGNGTSRIYYHFCSYVPGEKITRNSVK